MRLHIYSILFLLACGPVVCAQETTVAPVSPPAVQTATAGSVETDLTDPSRETSREEETSAATETSSSPDQVRVTVARLNVRARPGTSYEVVAKVHQGDILTVVGKHGDWLEITPPPGTAAWCSAKYVDARGLITGDKVRVRSGPGVVFSVFSTLDEGTMIEPVGPPSGQWQQIKVPAAATVWVHGQFTEKIIPEEPPAKDAVSAQADDSGEDNKTVPKLTGVRISDGPAGVNPTEAAGVSASDGDDEISDSEQPPPPPQPDEGAPVPALKDDPKATAAENPPADVTIDERFIDTDDQKPLTEKAVSKVREGTLVSLKTKATDFATHALIRREGDKGYLLCYLVSDFVDLGEWANHRVRVYGREATYPAWRVPVIHVTGIQLQPAP